MLEPMTSKEIERRVEGILKSVGVENELSYNVTKEDDGTFKKETVGSVPRLDHAKGELLALIQQETQETELYGLEKERKLLLDINRGYTSNPTNQSFYIKKAIIVDRHIAKLKGETK